MKEKSPIRLTTLIVLFPLVTLLLYGGLSYLFFSYTQHQEVKKGLDQYEKVAIESEQANLKEKVENLARFIRYYDGKSTDKIKVDVKNIINLTADIANNIYDKYQGEVDDTKLKEMIKNGLENIKFEKNVGYLFLLDLKGNVILHADEDLIGKNIMDIRDVNGKYIIQEFTKVIKEKGKGYINYYWYMVGEDKKTMYYKISYIKKLKAYDWYVGAGEYLTLMTKFVREDILEYIKANGTFSDGYFFVSDSLNKVVYQPENNSIEDKKLSRFRIEGLYRDDDYIAYTMYVAQYDWYITAVKELNRIQLNIEGQKLSSELKRAEDIRTNLVLMVFTWLISLLLSLYLSTIINKLLKNYDRQIKDSNEKLIFQSRQALIGELFPMIAHQWRQPINKIASVLALLRFELPEKEITYEEIDQRCYKIEENIEFMSETIDDFRTFYKPKENSKEANLKELINRSVDFLESAILKKNIKIIKELENVHYQLYTNEFLHVMINLIKNAIDSVSQKGTVIIKLYKSDAGIIVSVEDNGKGLDEKSMGKIFDPYFTTKKDSAGLGLYMTRMIIEKHMNSTIEVKKLAQGLKFIIRLRKLNNGELSHKKQDSL